MRSDRRPVQESLSPRTQAIKRQTVEIELYGRRYLLRYKNAGGYVVKATFPRSDEGLELAMSEFWRYVNQMQKEIERGY